LVGKNGSGKSTIKDCIDFCLYNRVSGRKKDKLPLKKIPNRINKNLYSSIRFVNNNNQDVYIEKCIDPNNFKILVDNEDITEKYKNFTEEQKTKLIGFSLSMYKTFISLNMKDFENFISLNETGKNELLNKLFQLDELNVYLSITKELYNQTTKNLLLLNDKIYNLNDSLENSKKLVEKLKDDDSVKIQNIKEKISSYKPRYIKLEEFINNEKNNFTEINKKYKNILEIKNDTDNEIKILSSKINSYSEILDKFNDGSCPICNSDLSAEKPSLHKKEIEDNITIAKNKIIKLKEYLNSVIIEMTKLSNNKENSYNLKTKYEKEFNNIKSDLIKLKTEQKILNENLKNINSEEIKNNHQSLKEEYDELVKKKTDLNIKETNYKQLIEILSSFDIKKNLILKLIEPVNKHLSYYLSKFDINFKVYLDEEFNAKLYQRDDIDPETISKGEAMIINLSIGLAYLCSILEFKNSNILFLDEVFDGVDVDNVDYILDLLKEISMKYNMNILTIHHNMLNMNKFDRIIKVKKHNYFSEFEDVKNK
jgi:DNA repair exonuclease SbcCD ATPase subunit